MSITLYFTNGDVEKSVVCNETDEDGDYVVTSILNAECTDGVHLKLPMSSILMEKETEVVVTKTDGLGAEYIFYKTPKEEEFNQGDCIRP